MIANVGELLAGPLPDVRVGIGRGSSRGCVERSAGAFDGVVEPVVQVYSKALGLVSYQGVDKDTAKRIVEETIIGGKILEDKKIEIKDGE